MQWVWKRFENDLKVPQDTWNISHKTDYCRKIYSRYFKQAYQGLPFTVTVTFVLNAIPKVFLATHLCTNTPPLANVSLHIPERLTSVAVSFLNSWYDVTAGLASAEQLNVIVLPWHALSSITDVVNCTFSGLSTRIKNITIINLNIQ